MKETRSFCQQWIDTETFPFKTCMIFMRFIKLRLQIKLNLVGFAGFKLESLKTRLLPQLLEQKPSKLLETILEDIDCILAGGLYLQTAT